MPNTTISQLPLSLSPNINYVVPSDNDSGTTTEKVTIQQICNLSKIYDVINLGTISGNISINFGPDRPIQTLSLNGTSTTFSKGSGWPTSANQAADVILNITVSSATSITWSIVTNWLISPPVGALTVGVHTFLLRAIGSTIVQGAYIGTQI